MAASPRKLESLHPGDILVVVHDFDARSIDELTLRKTERIELVELDEGFSDGWFLGRHLGREGTGLFPGVYCAKLPAHLAAAVSTSTPKHFSQPSHTLPELPANHNNNTTGSGHTRVPSGPKFAPYQHRSEPIVVDTRNLPDSSVGYGHATNIYGSQRNTLPSSSSNHAAIQRTISQSIGGAPREEDSPVMNETLNVIDEHITDLSTPRQSMLPNQSRSEDSESDYGSQLDRTSSFFPGPETDDEESGGLTRAEVSTWSPKQTAEHLRSVGVDPAHCQIFEEQEITGDVLLDMDQSFIYMKEYDFGVMGKRLKTWHKIRDFQNKVRGPKMSRQSSGNIIDSTEDVSRTQSRVLSGGTVLPRIPSLNENQGLVIRQSQQVHSPIEDTSMPPPLQTTHSRNHSARMSAAADAPPTAWRASMGPDSPRRPSAAFVRELSGSRRHSSIDYNKRYVHEAPTTTVTGASMAHKKQASLDRGWSMASASQTNAKSNAVKKPENLDMSKDSPILTGAPNLDLDRGYFSGNEVDNRKIRATLKKKSLTESPAQSLQSLVTDTQSTTSKPPRHSRLSSVDSIRDHSNPLVSSAARAYHGKSQKPNRYRSSSTRLATPRLSQAVGSPTVTNLESENSSPVPPLPSPTTATTYSNAMNSVQLKAKKFIGLRATSDAITNSEKETAISPPTSKESYDESPTGSFASSARSRSLDLDSTDLSSKGADQSSTGLVSTLSTRVKPKSKQQTSAYTRGLLKLSPAEARKQCDYSGWMKKKSSSLMTTWKPRLFILRGKRLSYYYSETDTVERGIIDISGHKVLVANSDAIVTLHAQITGATTAASPTSSINSPDTASPVKSVGASVSGPFYYKLVPPKAGLSRAVQFTKPTIHYFQVDTIAEGRKWMGEIMKATIEHDLTSFETTNKQKTISLAKAKARKERPPALKDPDSTAEISGKAEKKEPENGLNIRGVSLGQGESPLIPELPPKTPPQVPEKLSERPPPLPEKDEKLLG